MRIRTLILSAIAAIAAALDIGIIVRLVQNVSDPAHHRFPLFWGLIAIALLSFVAVGIVVHLLSHHAAGEDVADRLEEVAALLGARRGAVARFTGRDRDELEEQQRALRRQLRRLRGATTTDVGRHARNLAGPGATL